MRRWILAILALLLAGGYLFALGRWYDPFPRPVPPTTEPTQPTQPTEISTLPQETAAVLATEATLHEFRTHKPEADPEYALTARHAFVYDCEAGELLYSHGGMDDQLAPASLTKLLTAYVALRYLSPDEYVTCGEETRWIDPASSVAWVGPGDTVKVETLIRGMMMQSGNDAAYAAAVAAGRVLADDGEYPAEDALELFMEEVNAQAQALGLTGTHFATPDGLDTWDHYTTMTDLLQIALLVMDEPVIRHSFGLTEASIMYENGETHTYKSTNYLMHPTSQYYCPDACGMKTGTTKKAGSCLMSLFYNGERYILIGVLGCPEYEDRFADALQLYALYG